MRRRRMLAEINVVPYIDVMLVLLVIFMVNIAVGKYMHIQKIGIVAPINGVAEFWLFGAIIIMFSACALTKEKLSSSN